MKYWFVDVIIEVIKEINQYATRNGGHMQIFTVSLFGHRHLEGALYIEQKLEATINKLLQEKEYVEFLVGRDGEFDLLAASVIKRCNKAIGKDNCALVWVLPYITAEYRKHQQDYLSYYDSIELSQKTFGAHYKKAIQVRNKEMVERSDLVIFWVDHKSGGAYNAMRYAEQEKTKHINLSDM